jgi:beta-galactosidase/beta-glucuronidase
LAAAGTKLLVFEGVKMVSDVTLNGVYLGYTVSQFVRYVFDVTSSLSTSGTNVLTVAFPRGTDPRNNESRWMPCTGGWE